MKGASARGDAGAAERADVQAKARESRGTRRSMEEGSVVGKGAGGTVDRH
jgi:hypothetical protein